MVNVTSVINAYTDLSVELSTTEQVLFFRLFLVNSKTNWSDWFGVDNQRLLLYTGVKSEKTIITARNSLKQKGYIDFKSGKRGHPTQYTLKPIEEKYTVIDTVKRNDFTVMNTVKRNDFTVIDTVKQKNTVIDTVKRNDFTVMNTVKRNDFTVIDTVKQKNTVIDTVKQKNTVIDTVNSTVNNTVKTTGIIDDDIYIYNKSSSNMAVTDTVKRDENTVTDTVKDQCSEIMRLFQKKIKFMPSPNDHYEMGRLMDAYALDWVEMAILEAAKHGGRSVQYIARILQDWKNSGRHNPWEKPSFVVKSDSGRIIPDPSEYIGSPEYEAKQKARQAELRRMFEQKMEEKNGKSAV